MVSQASADYFEPLRRKIGVAMLILACVFAAGWVRSHFYVDSLGISSSRQMPGQIAFGIQSFRGRLGLQGPAVNYQCPPGWSSVPIENMPLRFLSLEDHLLVNRQFPYWLIVIPLTLVSAWLLFYSPPRQVDTFEKPVNIAKPGRHKRISIEQILLHLNIIHRIWLGNGHRR